VAGFTRVGRGLSGTARTGGADGDAALSGRDRVTGATAYSPSVANSIARSNPLRAAEVKRVLTDGNMCS
jgi:hypothetical protein